MATFSKSPNILHVGLQPQAIAALINQGASVTCIVEPSEIKIAEALGLSSVIVVGDVTSTEDVIAALTREGRTVEEFDRICSAREKTVLTAALVAGIQGNGALPPTTAVALRDKPHQKNVVRAAGIPVAEHWVINDIRELKEFATRLPVVLKPLNGVAAVNTFRIRSESDIEDRVDEALSMGLMGPWLVESWVDGAEMEVDGVVRGGEIKFFAVSPYLENNIFVRDGAPIGVVTLMPRLHSKLYERAGDLVQRCVTALDFRDGVFHIELFETSEGLIFSECGGRPGGGMIYASIGKMFGVDIFEEWAHSVLGTASVSAIGLMEPDRVYGWANLSAPAGRVIEMPGRQEILDQEDVAMVQMKVRVGDLMGDVTQGTNQRAGRVVVYGPDADAVDRRLRSLVRWFAENTVVKPTDCSMVGRV